MQPASASEPRHILIVKTSSLGDIIQSFPVLDFLHQKLPNVSIDWAVEERFAPLVRAHPKVQRVIPLPIRGEGPFWQRGKELLRAVRDLRGQTYDLLFDLQGNCKSGFVTWLAKANIKIGFGKKTAKEWPNVWATDLHFEIPQGINIRFHYLLLIQAFFQDASSSSQLASGQPLQIGVEEGKKLHTLLSAKELRASKKIMVCPGSRWANKQLPIETWQKFLKLVQNKLNASFLFIWGTEGERRACQTLHKTFPQTSLLIDPMPLPVWQNLMCEVDLVLAVDSGALHLAGTTPTPTFSIFGPSKAKIFQPPGKSHGSFSGLCPYGETFEKTCPKLRSCPTGACIRNLRSQDIFSAFETWWQCYIS